MTTGEALKRFRREMGLSQRAVAQKVDILPQVYARYESDQRPPTVPLILKLAEEYGVTTDYLLGRSDEPRAKTADALLVSAIINCRDSIQQVLNEVDRIKTS